MPEAVSKSSVREPGLDLLRILSMVMVITLHILGQGGILDAAEPGSTVWYSAWGLEVLCYCAVDCYGLLSGYLGAGGRKGAYPRLALLWLEVELYSLLGFLVFRLRSPELVGSQALLQAVFPVLTRQYWYFTGYFGLALLLPLLGGAGTQAARPRAAGGVFLLLLFFCALPTLLQTDAFHLRSGDTLLWLLLLYLMGALLRQSRFFLRLGALPLLLTLLVCFGLTLYTHFRPVTVPGLSAVTLLSYTSPTVAGMAVCLLLLLRRLRFGDAGARLLAELSRTAFGVYILHTNPLFWYLVFRPGCLSSWAALPAKVLLFLIPGCAVGAYLAFSLPAYGRLLLFRRLRLRERLEGLAERFSPPADR